VELVSLETNIWTEMAPKPKYRELKKLGRSFG
jgi:hypothetical protein